MDLRFDRGSALERLKNHSAQHYAGLYNVMKGVTLAVAGLTMVRLLRNDYSTVRFPLFAIGLLAIVVTYNGAIIGQTIVHLRTSYVDVLLPMGLTVAEFAVIGTAAGTPATEAIPGIWVLSLASWQILAALVVASVAHRLTPSMYTSTLWPAVAAYRKSIRWDAYIAGATGGISLAFWCVERDSLAEAGALEYAFILFTFATLLGALRNHEQTRLRLEQSLRHPTG